QDGYVAQRLDRGLGLSLGHIVVRAADPNAPGIPDAAKIAQALLSDSAVAAAAPRVRFEAFAQGADASAGSLPARRRPAAEAGVIWVSRALVEGKFWDDKDVMEPYPIVVGRDLARRLGVSLGGKVALLVEAEDRALIAEPFRVAGIFHTGAPLYDGGVAYVPRRLAARMMLVRGDAAQVAPR